MIFLLVAVLVASNGESATTAMHTTQDHFRMYNDNGETYILYENRDKAFIPLHYSITRTHEASANVLLTDSLETIWLPISAGGTVFPDEFIHNPTNMQMYVAGD